MKRSLRQKIITWFLVPTAIILVMVAVVTFYAYQRVTENLVIDRDRELTRLSADLLSADRRHTPTRGPSSTWSALTAWSSLTPMAR